MVAVRFSSGVAAQIESLSDRLVLAIDLGFSKSSKSCGVAWRDGTGQLEGSTGSDLHKLLIQRHKIAK
jgi:hypothetical protein